MGSGVRGQGSEGARKMKPELKVKTQRLRTFFLCAFCVLLCLCDSVSFGMDEGLWGRNPFLTVEEISLLQKKGALLPDPRKILLPTWEVQAVLISNSSKVVIVNDHILTIGDFLGDERILEIKEDGIVLGKNGKKRVIKQRQPFIPIEVKEKR